MHCVDLGESFQTHIYLQNLASIQPRTSLLKSDEMPERLLGRRGVQAPPGVSRFLSNFWLIFGKLWEARSRLYRSQNLQVNMRLKALVEIYTMHSFAQLQNLIFSQKLVEFIKICENKPLSGPRRRAPRPERGAWRWLCTAWVHSRKPCKRRTANRNEQKFTEQKRTCAIWNDSVGLIQHFKSRWPCRPLFRKCNNTSEHEFQGNGSCAANRVKLEMSTLGWTL